MEALDLHRFAVAGDQPSGFLRIVFDVAVLGAPQPIAERVVNQGYGILGMGRKGSQVLLVLGKPAE